MVGILLKQEPAVYGVLHLVAMREEGGGMANRQTTLIKTLNRGV